MKTKKISEPLVPVEAVLTLPRFNSTWRLFIYPGCILLPGAGLALGLLYIRQDDSSARSFGRICLGLALLGGIFRLSQGGSYDGFQGSDSLTRPFY